MGANKLCRRPGHDILVQVLGVEPGPVDIKRIAQPGVVDAVGIFLPLTGPDGVESLRNTGGLDHHNVLREAGVYRQGKLIQRNPGGGVEVGHVDLCVDPGIRSARPGAFYRMAHRGRQRLFQCLRHGHSVFLHLPPVVGRAVVHQL